MSRTYLRLPSLEISRDGFALRCIDDGDMEPIRTWRNAQMAVLRQAGRLTPDQQRRYFTSVIWPQMELEHPDTILLTILRSGERIGYGGLVHCAWGHARAEISVLFTPAIAADEREYGTCLSAFLAMLEDLAFDRLGFNRLTLETYDIRPFHVRLLEQAGYTREGRLRDHIAIEGERVDSLLHGKIASDRTRDRADDHATSERMTSTPTRSILTPASGAT
ncbi:MAG: GNAT family N-acetyltransferase [Erythrobacter sp.]